MLSLSHNRKFHQRSQAWHLLSSDFLSLNLCSASWLSHFWYCTQQLFLFGFYSYFTETFLLWGPVMDPLPRSKTQAPHSSSTASRQYLYFLLLFPSVQNCLLFTLGPCYSFCHGPSLNESLTKAGFWAK